MSTRPGRTSLPFASSVCFARVSAMSGSSAAITAFLMPMSRRARSFWLVSSTSPPLMTRSNLSDCANAPAPRPSKVPPAAAPARNSRREMGRMVFSVLFLLRLAFGRAGMVARAVVADHADRLDLDLDAGSREIRHRDERAPRIVAVLEIVFAHLDEAVAVARLLDEHRHLNDVGEAAAGALHDLVDLREHLLHLRLEIVGDIAALVVARRGLSREPDDLPAVGDDAGRERPRQLERGFLHVFRRGGGGRQRNGGGKKDPREHAVHVSPKAEMDRDSRPSRTVRATLTQTGRDKQGPAHRSIDREFAWGVAWLQTRTASEPAPGTTPHPAQGVDMAINFSVNGKPVSVNAPESTRLLWVLREELKLTGTKFGCGAGQCGACMVHIDGERMFSCLMPVSAAQGKAVTTIEGLSPYRMNALQRAWLAESVPQCGYCQSGQLMSAAALLAANTRPTREEIKDHMSANVCRCGTYPRIVRAIERAVREG